MDIKNLSIQELESYFNLTCKLRDSIIIMGRANNDLNSVTLQNLNIRYNLLQKEIQYRLDSLYEGQINNKKELLNEEVIH